jgi:hypothetical protein
MSYSHESIRNRLSPTEHGLQWVGSGLFHVIPYARRREAGDCCQICVQAIDTGDPCIVCVLSWSRANIELLPSWDFRSDGLLQKARPCVDIPTNAWTTIVAMRHPHYLGQWIEQHPSKSPPLRHWLAAQVRCWAGEYQVALECMEKYKRCGIAGELLDRATAISRLIHDRMTG